MRKNDHEEENFPTGQFFKWAKLGVKWINNENNYEIGDLALGKNKSFTINGRSNFQGDKQNNRNRNFEDFGSYIEAQEEK